jgi:tetratricopeptide (TPR) repeat protein
MENKPAPPEKSAEKKVANPFDTAANLSSASPAELGKWISETRKQQRNLILLTVALLMLVNAIGGYLVYRMLRDSRSEIRATHDSSSAISQQVAITCSNYLIQTRLAASQATFSAEQTKKNREWFTSIQVESVNALTNTAIDLNRQVSRQINEASQVALERFNTNFNARIGDLQEAIRLLRAALQKDYADKSAELSQALKRYDPLLKIDPDVAERIELALRNLKQLTEIAELLKNKQDTDTKNFQNQIVIVSEQIKMLQAMIEKQFTAPPTNPAPPVVAAPVATNAPVVKPPNLK